MTPEDVARRIVSDNQQARNRHADAFRGLTEQLMDPDKQIDVERILQQLSGDDTGVEASDSGVLAEEGPAGAVDGSDRGQTDAI